jgi:cytochrome b561
MIRNNSQRWGSISIGLHWLTALLIIGLSIVGLVMTELPNSPLKMQVYALHKSFGLTVLALTLLRLAWRFIAGAPADLPGSQLQTLAAKIVHGLMYFLLLAMPLSGWLFNSAAGFPLRWFKDLAHDLHESGFYLLAALLLVHAGAALFHHYVLKDDALKRMTGKMP